MGIGVNLVNSLFTVSIVEAIADDLRGRILSGDLESSAALTEIKVSSSYKVARPTAKAAIEKLVSEGLLVKGVHKTARVMDLGPKAVRDIYNACAYLEAEVLRRLASTRSVPAAAVEANSDLAALTSGAAIDVVELDMRFHSMLIDAMRNERISKMYRTLVGEIGLCMVRAQSQHLLDPTLLHAEHRRILEHIEDGQGEQAAILLDEHLGHARERLVAAIAGGPGPEAELS